MSFHFFPSKSLAIALVVGTGAFVAGPASAHSISSVASSATQVQLLAQAPGTIVDVAAGNDDFETLVQAVETAGLADTLSGEGPFTVFAPTDEAFDALPDGALEALLEPENRDLLTDILTYHVVPGEVMSSDLETGGVDSLNGGLAVLVEPDGVVVNDASVVAADVPASNGVIHAINRVLIPTETRAELVRRLQAAETVEAIPALW
ncbi:MAG: fasciclin domain-containing protein [Elainellaceae cyanobacterium]